MDKLKFTGFVRLKWYLLLFMLLACATYGSVRGAYKEHAKTIWITEEDVAIREGIDSGAISPTGIPSCIGYLGISHEQNEFRNFILALACLLLGTIPSILVLFVYYMLYDTNPAVWLRKNLQRKDTEHIMILR